MGRYASDTGGGDFTPAPAGNHIARCIQLIDIGTHHGEYQGEPTVRNQIIVRWELPNETIETDKGPQPMIVSKFYTNSLSEKANLRKDLEAWRGREFTQDEKDNFDLMNILNKGCLVTVIHNEKKKAKVTTVSALVKGMACPPAANNPSAFWIDEWDDNAYTALPEGFKKLIAESDEYKAAFTAPSQATRDPSPAGCDTDDIPF